MKGHAKLSKIIKKLYILILCANKGVNLHLSVCNVYIYIYIYSYISVWYILKCFCIPLAVSVFFAVAEVEVCVGNRVIEVVMR